MTEQEVRNLLRTAPFPETMEGKRKVHEHVYCSLYGVSTKTKARDKLKMAKWSREKKKGYYCTGGKHAGLYKRNGMWYAYLHFAQYA